MAQFGHYRPVAFFAQTTEKQACSRHSLKAETMLFTVFGIFSAMLLFIGSAVLGSLHLLVGGVMISMCTALWWAISRGASQRHDSRAAPAPRR